MPIRFRKSFGRKGLRLNLSKSGVGVSTGIKGLRLGVGPKGARFTANVPGSGLFFQKNIPIKSDRKNASDHDQDEPQPNAPGPTETVKPPRKPLFLATPRGRKVAGISCASILALCLLCLAVAQIYSMTPEGRQQATVRAAEAITRTYSLTLTPPPSQTPSPTRIPPSSTPTPIPPTETPTPKNTKTPTLTLTPTATFPPGTSGLCEDGAFTSSDTRQGACSGHGGISVWWGD